MGDHVLDALVVGPEALARAPDAAPELALEEDDPDVARAHEGFDQCIRGVPVDLVALERVALDERHRGEAHVDVAAALVRLVRAEASTGATTHRADRDRIVEACLRAEACDRSLDAADGRGGAIAL